MLAAEVEKHSSQVPRGSDSGLYNKASCVRHVCQRCLCNTGTQQCARKFLSSEESLVEDPAEIHPLLAEGSTFVIQPICHLV